MTIENAIYNSLCFGCGCCMNLCPTVAIHMEYDGCGYLKPVIKKEKCIECGKCSSECPAVHNIFSEKNERQPECYAVQACEDIRIRSSSGGFFTVLAEHIIDNGGCVYGAVWREDFQCEIVEASHKSELIPMRLSKYVQSKTGNSFKSVEKRLNEKRRVAYFGLPCQIAGLKTYLKSRGLDKNEQLLLIDLVCFGAPSDVYFRKYLEEEYGIQNVENVKFRDKLTHGWSPYSYSIELKEGTILKPDAKNDPYQRAFHGALIRNEICENCKFYMFPRQGDYTIGDFWGIQENDPSWLRGNGTSVVIVNNDKARVVFKEIEKTFYRCEQVPLEWCINRGNRIGNEARSGHIRKKYFDKMISEGRTFRESVERAMGSMQMIEFSNFRKEYDGNSVKVVCDTSMFGVSEVLPASNLWISTDISNESFLNEHICDGYLVAGMAFGMYYALDVRIQGKVSKKLYYNSVNYVQQIMINHDPGLHRINIFVDGFLTDDDFNKDRDVIGAPCSFGVDNLSTLYDRWLNEDDEEYKINRVFSFNCGTNGPWEDDNTSKLYSDRKKLWEKGFGELGLDIVHIDTNIHQYLHSKMFAYNDAMYLSRYFCILNMQSGVKRYYLPSEFSYWDLMNYGELPFRPNVRGEKLTSYGWEEPFLVPLLETEHMNLVLDGAQYQRTEKTERIADWNFSYKYLNVCTPRNQLEGDFSRNCSMCIKCTYTMFCLDVMGKLDLYKDVFDLKKYYANRFRNICEMVSKKNDDVLIRDVIDYAIKKDATMVPSERQVRKYYFYKWRFPNLDQYIYPIQELFKKYEGRRILWGTGMIGAHVMAVLDVLDLKVDAVVDTDITKQGKNISGYIIQNYQEIKSNDDVIFVCGMNIYSGVLCNVERKEYCIDVYSTINA